MSALACSSARRAHRWTQHKSFDWRSSGRPWHAWDTYVPEELQRAEPVKKIFVLLPAWNRLDWRRVIDFLKRIPFHLQIRPRVNLGCFDVYMAEEVADHVKRDSALQQVHSLCVSERVRTHCPVQAGALVSCFDEIFLKDVADSRTRESLIARVLEKRLIELFGAIEMMFPYVIA